MLVFFLALGMMSDFWHCGGGEGKLVATECLLKSTRPSSTPPQGRRGSSTSSFQGGGGNSVFPLSLFQCHSSGEGVGFFLTDKGDWKSRFSTWPLLIERGPTFFQCYLAGRVWLLSKCFCLARLPIFKFFAENRFFLGLAFLGSVLCNTWPRI